MGGLKPTWRRSVKTSLIFGLWDAVAPAVGIVLGHYLSQRISSTADMIAAVGLAAYGLFVVIRALVRPEPADPDMKWATRGLALPLSIDNVTAGASLGLAGYSPWLAPILFGVITFVMSVAGHQIGRAAASFIPRIRTDLLTGIAFLAMAVLVATGTGGDDDAAAASSGRPQATTISSTHTADRRDADHYGPAALAALSARRDVSSTSIWTP
ncbi:MAG TPA: manganese efflux pump [Solirubrobacteraceae bacterium]|nr:manganese efflux pump [Solirubrobacteraceae bacterium]